MKKLIGIIVNFGHTIYRKVTGMPEFTSSNDYWKNRYQAGGNSGVGSYNNLAEFKGEVINSFLEEKGITSVIELGCGDGNQLTYLKPKKYLGFDVSDKALQLCEQKFKGDLTKVFKPVNSYCDETAELTMSLDVIYHLIEDQTFHEYMTLLFKASSKNVIVYSSNKDENQTVPHVKHRKFTDWVENKEKSFKLLHFIPNKYPLSGLGLRTSFADFYIFEKA